MKLFTSFAAAAVLALSAVAAQAAPFPLVQGDKFQVNFRGSDDDLRSDTDDFLGASAQFTVTSVGTDSVSLSVILANLGSTLNGSGSRITAFGFLTPGLTSATVSGVWINALVGDGIAPTAHGVSALLPGGANICATTNNCGAGTDGVDAGTSGEVVFTLQYGAAFGGTAPTLDNFFVRFQRITYPQGQGGSGSGGGVATSIFECVDDEKDCGANGGNGGGDGNGGGNGGNGGGNGGTVPEPATMALLGLGLAGAGVFRRRK